MTSTQTWSKPGARSRPAGIPVAAAPSRRWSREWIYFAAVLVAWFFVPLLRRLIDWHNGYFNPVQVTSTLPFLLTLPLALTAFRRERLARLTPAFKLFASVWAAAFGYALLMAVVAGNISAAVYEATQYLVPMLAGIWLAGGELTGWPLLRRLATILLGLAAIVAIYGVLQFVAPAPWDVLWVQGGNFVAMGQPVPFGLRIFSTLNSAGPAADFFALMLIVALPFCRIRNVWGWPLATLLGGALLLTLVRASWIAAVVGIVVYVAMSPSRWRSVPFLALYGLLLAFLITSLPSLLGAGADADMISSRIATLGDVSHDDSALARQMEIDAAINQGLANPLGTGLGQVGSSAALSANPDTASGNVLDSGYLARFIEMGWLGFAGYVFVVFGTLAAMFATLFGAARRTRISRSSLVVVATALAMCAALAWIDAAGDAHFGLDGLLFWLALGMGLRPPVQEPAKA